MCCSIIPVNCSNNAGNSCDSAHPAAKYARLTVERAFALLIPLLIFQITMCESLNVQDAQCNVRCFQCAGCP